MFVCFKWISSINGSTHLFQKVSPGGAVAIEHVVSMHQTTSIVHLHVSQGVEQHPTTTANTHYHSPQLSMHPREHADTANSCI